ncbi:MAG: nucleotide exchange factor GrpE [Nitrospirota bacterium]|nr:nucleotide exchange factor GrpE [Nitrospirota bacterium]
MSATEFKAASGGDDAEGQVEVQTEDQAAAEAVDPVAAAQAVARLAEERHVRLYAEFENYKKRIARENEDFRKYANEALLRDLLGVVDDLDRAIGHGRAEDGGGKLLEGVEMIRKQFGDILEKFGVTPVPALGVPFDPAVHQAVSQVESSDHADGAVAEEFRKGYFFHQRVLRPAMVVVAKNKG